MLWDVRGGEGWGSAGVWEISVPSAQFHHEPKTALKIKFIDFFFKGKIVSLRGPQVGRYSQTMPPGSFGRFYTSLAPGGYLSFRPLVEMSRAWVLGQTDGKMPQFSKLP